MNHQEYIENELEFVTNKLEKPEESYNLIERKEKRHIDYKLIGIVFRTYIVVEIDSENGVTSEQVISKVGQLLK